MSKTRFGQSVTKSAEAAVSLTLTRLAEVREFLPKCAEELQRVLDRGIRAPGRPEKSPSPRGQKPHLTDKQWLALERELRGYQEGADQLKDNWPARTAAQMVAEAADVTRQMVHKWRKNPQYRRGLYWLMKEKLPEHVECMAANDPGFKEFCGEPSALSDED